LNTLFDLTGKVAVVTASTKGMGLAIARALGSAGAKLVISGRSQETADAAAARLREEDGFEVAAFACDITDPGSVQRFAADALAAFGRVDALVLNAAGNPPLGSILGHTVQQFDETMAGGVRGNLALVWALAPQMIERKNGSIVFMSSRAARDGCARLVRDVEGRDRPTRAQPRTRARTIEHQRQLDQPGCRAYGILPRSLGRPGAREIDRLDDSHGAHCRGRRCCRPCPFARLGSGALH